MSEPRKPGQFTGKWEVYSPTAVCATGMTQWQAANLIENWRRYRSEPYSMRRSRVPMPPDIAALDAGDDE